MLPKSRAKYIQSLHHKKYRQQEGAFIAEGPKVVAELIKRQPGWLKEIYGTKEWKQAQSPVVWETIANLYFELEDFELEKISALQTPQQVLAVAAIPETAYIPDNDWLLLLDGIQDPGNLGTIIRTAHWFGIYRIICSPNCADAFSPKVVQASMGSLFKVAVVYKELFPFLSAYKQPVYGAMLNGESFDSKQTLESGAIVIGNEGRGISASLLPFITLITIPGTGDAESLNAAVAAGILMSEINR